MASDVRHPIFARIFVWLSRGADAPRVAERRGELLAGLSGRVVEVGAGNGKNFPHYPETVDEAVAVEPEPYLRHVAEDAARQAQVPIRIVAGVAEELPLEDSSFDAAVVSLVLCSVGEPARALAEIKRVLKPGGELRFWEHVRADDSRLRRLQRALEPLWPFFGGGCHLTRDTEREIEAAGFVIEGCRRFRFKACLLEVPVSPQILGRARKAASA